MGFSSCVLVCSHAWNIIAYSSKYELCDYGGQIATNSLRIYDRVFQIVSNAFKRKSVLNIYLFSLSEKQRTRL